ncbi:MAG: RNA polymerase sigma factor [Rubripirellula sp.]
MSFEPSVSDLATRPSLLVRLQETRDEQAWSEFTAVYEPVIYRMAKRRGLQDADAREIVQEVLLSVSSAIGKFDINRSGSFRGWLSRVTRNATVDRLRKVKSRNEINHGSDFVHAIDGAIEKNPEEEFDGDHRKQLFRWAASTVRTKTGEVNWMAFWKTSVEGSTIEAVAAELGIAAGAVYVARCRILKRIRELVHERIEE